MFPSTRCRSPTKSCRYYKVQGYEYARLFSQLSSMLFSSLSKYLVAYHILICGSLQQTCYGQLALQHTLIKSIYQLLAIQLAIYSALLNTSSYEYILSGSHAHSRKLVTSIPKRAGLPLPYLYLYLIYLLTRTSPLLPLLCANLFVLVQYSFFLLLVPTDSISLCLAISIPKCVDNHHHH